jgi:hypothetical protein
MVAASADAKPDAAAMADPSAIRIMIRMAFPPFARSVIEAL